MGALDSLTYTSSCKQVPAAQVPEWLEEPLLHLVHHSSTTLEGLTEKALAKFNARYLVGEELAALDEGKERPCVIRAITSAKRPDGI